MPPPAIREAMRIDDALHRATRDRGGAVLAVAVNTSAEAGELAVPFDGFGTPRGTANAISTRSRSCRDESEHLESSVGRGPAQAFSSSENGAPPQTLQTGSRALASAHRRRRLDSVLGAGRESDPARLGFSEDGSFQNHFAEVSEYRVLPRHRLAR